jgi:hypothetical protein
LSKKPGNCKSFMPSSRLGMQLLCPARSQSRREFGELAYKTGNCGIICSGRAGNLDPVVSFRIDRLQSSTTFRKIRHLLAISPQTRQASSSQPSHTPSHHRASNLAFATRGHQPGARPNNTSWTYCKLLRGPLSVLA